MNSEVAEKPKGEVSSIASAPQRMLEMAIDRGASLEQLQQLMDLQERHEANEARKAFHDAVAAFKENPPKVTKDKENKQYGSRYASLENLVGTVNAALSPHGLNARWDFHQSDNTISVTCILSHRLGHSERVTLAGPPDVSGSKNPLQEIKSTTTYLKGATFEAVTGVASGAFDTSDDGNSSGSKREPVTEEQEAELQAMLDKIPEDRQEAFMKWAKIRNLSQIVQGAYDEAHKALAREVKKQQGEKTDGS